MFHNSHVRGSVYPSAYATVVAEELIRAGGLPEYLRGLEIRRIRERAPTDPVEVEVEVSAAPDPGWTTGEGKRRRLTYEGELELERRLAENQSNHEIAKAIGVRRYTVIERRQRMNSSRDNDLP
jgi:hypothetical protein